MPKDEKIRTSLSNTEAEILKLFHRWTLAQKEETLNHPFDLNFPLYERFLTVHQTKYSPANYRHRTALFL